VVGGRRPWRECSYVRLGTFYIRFFVTRATQVRKIVHKQAERGFATSRLCVVTDEDGTILAHILHGSDWYIEKGGNALQAPDEMRDFYPPQAS
jgi:hypothetical protein